MAKNREEIADSLRDISYCLGKTEGTINDYLDKYNPSEIHRDDGIDGIWVFGKDDQNLSKQPPDVAGLLKEWDELMTAETHVTGKMMKKLAIKYNVKSGKWLIHVPAGPKVEILWRKIATCIVENNLNGNSSTAKIRPRAPDEEKHVISVYNSDCTNDDEIFALEKAIRVAGVKHTLFYKPDVYTHCKIYRGNEWGVRPGYLISEFDIINRESRIMTRGGEVIFCNKIS